MERTDSVEALIRVGRFLDALEALQTPAKRMESTRENALRAWVLERIGRTEEGSEIAARMLRRGHLSDSDMAICEFCLGQVAWETAGDPREAILHLQKAITSAESAGERWKSCFFRLRLMIMLADKEGPASVVPLLARLRADAIKLGDPTISAALHIFVAETETKRGLRRNAERHVRLGQALLATESNPWLSCIAETVMVANAIMTSNDDALARAELALRLAEEAGAASMQRACLGNIGIIHHLAGRYTAAISWLERALAVLPARGERANAAYDAMARVRMSEGDYPEASRLLKIVEDAVDNESDWLLWGNRYARITRAEWCLRQGLFDQAAVALDHASHLATCAGDHFMLTLCLLVRAQLLTVTSGDPFPILAAVAQELPQQPPEFQARYESAVGLALAARGEPAYSVGHFTRAERICEHLRNEPLLLEVRRSRDLANRLSSSAQSSTGALGRGPLSASLVAASTVVQDIASILVHAGRPQLVASEIVAVLAQTDSVVEAKATLRRDDGEIELLASIGQAGQATSQDMEVSSVAGRSIAVSLVPKQNAAAAAVVNATSFLLKAVRELERANAEREERITLWPLEDEPEDDGDGIILGHMRELMTFAKRVAKTNISVLITGESGTGKEILARAIHKYSTRADRPFMPFNCTAIPRDMLESQLFGHRRGAFTSADRDNPGLIRAARGGTLFLDEIGELGMDLQPKLLRFLESGEISPLGDTGPLTVDVRIIAATNRDLEELVRAERFREDLFYRLNVIRLTILPLRERRDEIPALLHHFVARSARDLGKGQLRIAEETMERFLLYPWPGNVRQLQNEVRRIVALAEVDGVLTPDMLSADIRKAGPRGSTRRDGHEVTVPITDKLSPAVAHVERELIRAALKKTHGRVDAAAKVLGISRKGLYLKRQRLGI